VVVFWYAIVVGLLFLEGARTFTSHPTLLLSWDGVLTILLSLIFITWFAGAMSLRRARRRHVPEKALAAGQMYALFAVGLAITLALMLLHREFTDLLFVDLGIAVMGFNQRATLLLVSVIVAVFIIIDGPPQLSAIDLGSGLLSLGVTIGLTYSVKMLVEQRIEHERLIAELRDAQQQLRQSAAREVELAALRERNRLAREMHDSLGHALVLIAVKIEAAQRLQAIDAARSATELEDTKALVRSTMGDLRNSLAGLRLSALEDRPFGVALADMGADLGRRTGIDIDISTSEEADTLDRATQEALYRVAQEALTNVARHAQARHAWVHLALSKNIVELEVSDDGIGLNAAPRPGTSHFGITGMRERVQALGGVLTIGPRAGAGTLLRVSIPLKEHADV
jgi:signal transduction histidine kinase